MFNFILNRKLNCAERKVIEAAINCHGYAHMTYDSFADTEQLLIEAVKDLQKLRKKSGIYDER